ncbi:MAG: VWA domain-containing protein [Thermoanaerobaculia bacterium]|nr:VWA domain-containing protein [Thermoanaerobaculia bacterium]
MRQECRASFWTRCFAWSLLSMTALTPLSVLATEDIEVFLRLPEYGVALFGDVEVGVDVYPAETEIDRVEFYVDGLLAAVVRETPWQTTVDVGQDNKAHEFVVQVYEAGGTIASSTVMTPRMKTDEVVEVKLQQLYVAVHDRAGRVLDLKREDFKILDNRKQQELITFESGDVPFSAVLLLDASHSMRGGRLEVALEGARSFLTGMKELDQAKLVLHSDHLIQETPFTSFGSVLSVGLAGARAGGGTALNDHLYLALKRLETVQGRRVVIILSDGFDVESVLSMAQVRWVVRQLQPVIYWIRLVEGEVDSSDPSLGDRRSFWRDPREHRSEIRELIDTVEESGGRIDVIRSIDQVETSFRWILEDLRNQYVLGYLPNAEAGDDGRHEVDVYVDRRGLDVRTRGSYLDSPRWTGDR